MAKSNAAPPAGQKNLFSFFTKKKPAAASSAASAAIASPSNAAPNDTTTKSRTIDNNKNNNNTKVRKGTAKSISSSSNHQKLLSRLTLQTKLAVFWPDDNEYYPCTIKEHRTPGGSTGNHVYTLHYEDGEVETVDLSTERFRIIGGVTKKNMGGGGNKRGGTEEDEEDDEVVGGTSNNKKRRRILEDSEEEMDLDEEESSAEEGDDSGSEFKAGDIDSHDESLDHVDEDSEEEFSEEEEFDDVDPKKKPKKKSKVTVTRVNDNKSASFVSPTPLKSGEKGGASNKNNDNLVDFSSFTSQSPLAADTKIRGSSAPKSAAVASSFASSSAGTTASKHSPMAVSQTQQEQSTAPPKPIAKTVNQAGSHFHNHLTFFTSGRRDMNKHAPNHPDYSPRTLLVDYNELERKHKEIGGTLSPAQRQWWDIKCHYADTVLLFKTGKFYEMFHDDADVGVAHLDFNYMSGTAAHAGFPEAAYDKFVGILVEKGYKVARVEQTETPDMLNERKKRTSGKKPSVVNREVCCVVSKGTRTFCYLEDTSCFEEGSEKKVTTGPLVVIKEVLLDADSDMEVEEEDVAGTKAVCEYGVTVVDAITGVVTLGQFADDILRSRMQTLLASYSPSEVLIEGGASGASKTLVSLLKSACPPTTVIDRINPKENFPKSNALDSEARKVLNRTQQNISPWNAEDGVKELHRRAYYPRSSRKNDPSAGGVGGGIGRWPEVLRACVDGGASLALSSFGAALFYLQRSLVGECH